MGKRKEYTPLFYSITLLFNSERGIAIEVFVPLRSFGHLAAAKEARCGAIESDLSETYRVVCSSSKKISKWCQISAIK